MDVCRHSFLFFCNIEFMEQSEFADLEERVAALEAKLERLQSPLDHQPPAPRATTSTQDPLWMLAELQHRYPDGVVSFAGHLTTEAGEVAYQWGRPTDYLLAATPAPETQILAALGHPLRLDVLRVLLRAPATSATIGEAVGVSSTGMLYHHLGDLAAAGWVNKVHRGMWEIPASCVIPLLTILCAVDALSTRGAYASTHTSADHLRQESS